MRADDPPQETEALRASETTAPVARTAPNQEWALDFVHDRTEHGRTLRWLVVGDAYTREGLALEVDTSFPSRRVTRVLDAIAAERGLPTYLRCDNVLTAERFGVRWAQAPCGVQLKRATEVSLYPSGFHTQGFRCSTIATQGPPTEAAFAVLKTRS